MDAAEEPVADELTGRVVNELTIFCADGRKSAKEELGFAPSIDVGVAK